MTQWRIEELVGVKQRGNEQVLQWKKRAHGNAHNKAFKNWLKSLEMSQERVIMIQQRQCAALEGSCLQAGATGKV